MKFKITITQDIKYGETIIGYFDALDWDKMYKFINAIVLHFEKTHVEIELIADEEEQDEPTV